MVYYNVQSSGKSLELTDLSFFTKQSTTTFPFQFLTFSPLPAILMAYQLQIFFKHYLLIKIAINTHSYLKQD